MTGTEDGTKVVRPPSYTLQPLTASPAQLSGLFPVTLLPEFSVIVPIKL